MEPIAPRPPSQRPWQDPGALNRAMTEGKIGLWEWNVGTNEVKWSAAVYAIHGVDPKSFEVTFENFRRLIHPEDVERVQSAILQTLDHDAPYELEFRILRPDGKEAWVFTNGTVVRQDGKALRIMGATIDITARHRADDASLWLAAVVDSSSDAIISKDLNSIITTWNSGAQRLFGYTAAEIVGQPITILMPEDRKSEEIGILEQIRSGQRVEHYETIRQRKDGTLLHVSLTVSPVKDSQGRIVGASKIVRDISERKRSEAALRGSEERFRLLASHAPVGIFLSDLGGACIFVNARWCEMSGFTQEQAQGSGWASAVHPDDRARVLEEWHRAVERGHPSVSEFRFRRPDGSVVWVHGSAVCFNDEGGLRGYLGSCVDITQRKQAELQTKFLHELGGRLAGLDDPALIRATSQTALGEYLGADRCFFVEIDRENTGGHVAEDWHRPGLASLAGHHRIADYGSAELRERIMGPQFSIGDVHDHRATKDQRQEFNRWRIRSFATSAFWQGGRWMYSLVVTTREPRVWSAAELGLIEDVAARTGPIIEQARALQALRRSEKLHRAIGESIDYGIWVCDPEGRNIYASESFLKLTGLTQQQCSDVGWASVLHPDDAAATIIAWKECARQGTRWEREHRVKGVDGQWHPILARGVPVRDENGQIQRWVGLNLDISDIKRVQDAARRGESQLRLVTDHAPVYLVQVDRDHRFKFVNQPYAERFGLNRDQVIGRTVGELTGPDAYKTFRHQMEACLAGRRIEFEQEIPYATLGRRWVHVIYEPERTPEGEVIGLVAVIVDVTNRKQAEFELARTRDEALAASRAKDEFMAALSHELRTPLNPVLLLASDGATNAALPAEIRQTFETIRRNVSLEARLIDDLLDLAQINRGELQLEKARVDVHQVLQDTVANLRPEIDAKHLNLQLFLGARQTTVSSDSIRLQQVFTIVLQNSVRFTREGGQVTVVSRVVPESNQLCIEITDNGVGMSPAELANAFAGFDTGRPHGASRSGGLGLGLSIARQLLQMQGGRIEAASPGRNRGSAFVIELPLASADDAKPGTRPPIDAGGAAPRPPCSILLVEDHVSTRETLQKLLTRRNYEVIAAGSVTEALAVAATRTFDFLVSDVGLPDGDGYQLMAEIRKTHPTIQGVALSGYGMEEDIQRSHQGGFSNHLVKPVSITSLEQALSLLHARTVST